MKTEVLMPTGPITLTLEMTKEEAMVLNSIMRNISGSSNGARGVADSIQHALAQKGIGSYRVGGDIYFPNTWAELERTD